MRTISSFLVLFLALIAPVAAQTGSIAGIVVDAENGETLVGANIVISRTTVGTTTDVDGRYEISSIEPGTYDVRVSFIGYNALVIQNIEVRAGAATRVDVQLKPESIGLDEVTVEARALRNNEATLLRDRQRASAISDAISAEAIGRSGSSDAAAAMTRVTGASVVSGRYVYIRGLGDRYSSTHLNGSEMPSADPDRKAFQLDLLPASLLDNIVTTKTFTPDKPGNFSGGLVNVGTKAYPDNFTLQFSTSSTYVAGTSLTDGFLTSPGGSSDWLGFDDGTRGLPSILNDPSIVIPRNATDEIRARRNPELAANLDRVAKAFSPYMAPTIRRAPMNRSFTAAIGTRSELAGRPLGMTASYTYGRSLSSYSDGEVGRWEMVGGSVIEVERLTPIRHFGNGRGIDQMTSDEVTWGAMASLSYKPHPRHEISGTYLRTQSGTAEARYLNGFWRDLAETSTFETRVISYAERALASYQLKGEHALGAVTAQWNASLSRNNQDEPDRRLFSNHFSVRERDGGVDTLYSSPASLYPAPQRIFRDLAEAKRQAGVDLSFPLPLGRPSDKFKIGGSFLETDRDFRERRFEYREGRGASYPQFGGNEFAYFSAAGIVDSTDTGTYTFGNYIIETSALKNNYDARQQIAAGYAMLDAALVPRLRMIAGVRFETTDMETVSHDSTMAPGSLTNRDWLPSLNLVYSLTENANLRLAGSQTLARPTFRELAPYSTVDFVGDFVFVGNPSLKRTLITNADLRWEWFTRPGEILAASVFYKQFRDPIERVILLSMGNNTVSAQNVPEARVSGLELEARKRMDGVGGILEHVQIGANVTLVRSEVDISESELTIIRRADPDHDGKRPLQGQSPYIVNLDLSYESPVSATSFSTFLNIFGDRLMTVSEGATPDVYERPRATLDMTLGQRLPGGFNLKAQAKNILGADVLQTQRYRGEDYIYQRYERGRQFSIGISYAVQ